MAKNPNNALFARYNYFWLSPKGKAYGGQDHADIARDILKANFRKPTEELYRELLASGYVRVLAKRGQNWVERTPHTEVTRKQREFLDDLHTFSGVEVEENYYNARRDMYRENDEFETKLDEVFLEMVGERPKTGEMAAQVASNRNQQQNSKPSPEQGISNTLEQAFDSASQQDGDSPDDEEAILQHLKQKGISPNSVQGRNLARSLSNVSNRLGKVIPEGVEGIDILPAQDSKIPTAGGVASSSEQVNVDNVNLILTALRTKVGDNTRHYLSGEPFKRLKPLKQLSIVRTYIKKQLNEGMGDEPEPEADTLEIADLASVAVRALLANPDKLPHTTKTVPYKATAETYMDIFKLVKSKLYY